MSEPARPMKKAEQAALTRGELLRVSRELFTAKGFGHTGTEEIVAAAGVTMGALYYHFKDKKNLFEVVFDEVAAEEAREVRETAAKHADAWEGFVAGCLAAVDFCRRPEMRQIVLLDGPSVLAREIIRRPSIEAILEPIPDSGLIQELSRRQVVRLIDGVLHEAGLAVSKAGPEEYQATREVVEWVLRKVRRGG